MFDHFYVTGVGIFGYVFIYAPLAYFITRLVYRYLLKPIVGQWLGSAVAISVMAFVLAAPVWDVYQIGQETKRLCTEKAGVHVYKTVMADGARVGPGIEIWSKYGYLYTEGHGRGNKKYRYTMRDGKPAEEEVDEFISQYGSIGGYDRVLDKHHGISSLATGDVNSRELLGELVLIKTYPGWIDSIFLAITGTGSGFTPWMCGDEPPPDLINIRKVKKLTISDLTLITIKPNMARGQ